MICAGLQATEEKVDRGPNRMSWCPECGTCRVKNWADPEPTGEKVREELATAGTGMRINWRAASRDAEGSHLGGSV